VENADPPAAKGMKRKKFFLKSVGVIVLVKFIGPAHIRLKCHTR
jgi:hypothetical protein